MKIISGASFPLMAFISQFARLLPDHLTPKKWGGVESTLKFCIYVICNLQW